MTSIERERDSMGGYATASSSSGSSSPASTPPRSISSSSLYAFAAQPSSREISPWTYSPTCQVDDGHTTGGHHHTSSSTAKVSLGIAERIAGYLSLKDLIDYLALDVKAKGVYEVGRMILVEPVYIHSVRDSYMKSIFSIHACRHMGKCEM